MQQLRYGYLFLKCTSKLRSVGHDMSYLHPHVYYTVSLVPDSEGHKPKRNDKNSSGVMQQLRYGYLFLKCTSKLRSVGEMS